MSSPAPIPFDEFRPDAFGYNTTYTTILNVAPGANSYKPVRGLSAFNSSALASTCRGLTLGRKIDGTWKVYVGTQTKLYVYNSGSFTDATRTVGGNYALVANEYWRFVQFGSNLVAVNGSDAPQLIDVEAGTNFAALGGSPPVARNVTAVGEFLVLSGLPSNPFRIQWSAIGNIASWTIGTSLSDVQDFGDGGRVTGVAGGETGYVLQEYAIRRMRFLPGSDYVFAFEKVVEGKGCISPYAFATVAGTVFFLSEDGFYSYSGEGLNPIGSNRVNDWFLGQIDANRIQAVNCVADPYRTRIYWFYHSSASATNFDRVLMYDWALDRWAPLNVTAQFWGSAATPAVSLDSLSGNLDVDYTTSFDSRVYSGGRPTVAAIDASGFLAFFDGQYLEATLETAEIQPMPFKRSRATEAHLFGGSSDAVISVGHRETFQETVVYDGEVSRETNTKYAVDSSGRLLRYKVRIPSGSSWSDVSGIGVNHVPAGDFY